MNKIKYNTRITDSRFNKIFSKKIKFSKNLIKYSDEKLLDSYDHNSFSNNKDVTLKELYDAIKYQKDNNFNYLKIITYNKLKKEYINKLNLEENEVVTMLYKGNSDKLKINDKVVIKPISLKDLNYIEIKHYEIDCGEWFCKRRNKRYLNKSHSNKNFIYYGAYINNKIVGTCHSFSYKGYTCIDSLLVDNYHRHKHIASTLLKNIICTHKNVYLHADKNEKEFNYYKKLGFVVIDKYYDYYKKIEL